MTPLVIIAWLSFQCALLSPALFWVCSPSSSFLDMMKSLLRKSEQNIYHLKVRFKNAWGTGILKSHKIHHKHGNFFFFLSLISFRTITYLPTSQIWNRKQLFRHTSKYLQGRQQCLTLALQICLSFESWSSPFSPKVLSDGTLLSLCTLFLSITLALSGLMSFQS